MSVEPLVMKLSGPAGPFVTWKFHKLRYYLPLNWMEMQLICSSPKINQINFFFNHCVVKKNQSSENTQWQEKADGCSFLPEERKK